MKNFFFSGWRLILLELVTAVICAAQVPVYLASTVAGNGGPPATSALTNAAGIALDSAGNAYISDGSSMVYKLTPKGVLTVVAGGGRASTFLGDGGPATSATLLEPTGVAVDGSGNIYIADTVDNRIRKVSAGGTITTIAGGNAVGALGDGGPATSAVLSLPKAVAVNAAGAVFVADTGHNRVRMIAPDGTITTVAGNGATCSPGPVCGGPTGSLGDGGPATTAVVSAPVAIALDSAGNLYMTDFLGLIRKVRAADGVITTVAGTGSIYYSGDGGPAALAGLYLNPNGVAVDGSGTIYVSDSGHFAVRAITPDGNINAIAGDYVATEADPNSRPPVAANTPALSIRIVPEAIAVGANGTVYVANFGLSTLVLTPSSATVHPPPSAGMEFEATAFTSANLFQRIALGSWVEIYGNYLAPDSRTWAGSDFTGTTAPTALDGTSVTIGGQPAYISYISPGQVNVQVPTTIGTGSQPLVISTAHGKSPTYAVTVQAELPGLLAPPVFNIKGTQYGVALFPDGVTYALPVGAIPGVPSRPAQAGDTLTFYGTGFGPTKPDISAGQIAPSGSSLAQNLTVFFVTPVGAQATVLYAGLAPGFVGLYQFNVVVPKLPATGAQGVFFSLGAAGSTSVTIATK
jgi:uncharacterized protein (TIGR03437 family)